MNDNVGYLYIISIPDRVIKNVYKFGRSGTEVGILKGRQRDNYDLQVFWQKQVSNYKEHEANILCILRRYREPIKLKPLMVPIVGIADTDADTDTDIIDTYVNIVPNIKTKLKSKLKRKSAKGGRLSEWISGLPLNVIIHTAVSYLEMYEMTNGLIGSFICFGMASVKPVTGHIQIGLDRWDAHTKEVKEDADDVKVENIKTTVDENKHDIKVENVNTTVSENKHDIKAANIKTTVSEKIVNVGTVAFNYGKNTVTSIIGMFNKLKIADD